MLPFIEMDPLLNISPDNYVKRKADLLEGTQGLPPLTSEELNEENRGTTDISLANITLPEVVSSAETPK